jgi:hypothetical protein
MKQVKIFPTMTSVTFTGLTGDGICLVHDIDSDGANVSIEGNYSVKEKENWNDGVVFKGPRWPIKTSKRFAGTTFKLIARK